MRNIYKTLPLKIEDQPREFRLKKLDAFSGAFLLRLLMKHLPEGSGSPDKVLTSGDLISLIFTALSEEELRSLMATCLGNTEVLLEAGYQPVMQRGEWSYSEMEYDAGSCMKLTIESVLWTLEGFFGGSGSSSRPAAPDANPPSP